MTVKPAVPALVVGVYVVVNDNNPPITLSLSDGRVNPLQVPVAPPGTTVIVETASPYVAVYNDAVNFNSALATTTEPEFPTNE